MSTFLPSSPSAFPAGPLVLPSDPDALQALRERTVSDARGKQDGVREAVEQQYVDGVLGMTQQSFEKRAEKIFRWNGPLWENAGALAAGFNQALDGGLKAELEVFGQEAPQSIDARITQIREALATSPDMSTAERPEKHRYFTARKVRDRSDKEMEPWYYFDVNFQRIDKDVQFLEGLKTAYPQQTATWEAMRQQLQTLERQHPEYGLHQWWEARKQNPVHKAVADLGKITGVLFFGTAALFNGITAIATNSSPAAAGLHAGIAAWIASPRLRRMFLNGKAENTLANVNETFNNGLLASMKNRPVQGPLWESIAETIMARDKETKAFMKLLAENSYDPTKLPADSVRAYLNHIVPGTFEDEHGLRRGMPDAWAVREQLRDMITTNTFPGFAHALLSVRGGADVKQVVTDYIRMGSNRYNTDRKMLKSRSLSH